MSAEGLARFEQRARQRRLERRLDAARAAVRRRRFNEARAALAEVRELDASRPELAAVTLDLEAAERARAARRPGGPLLAAAATFAAMTLTASLIGSTGLLQSYPMTDIAALAPAPEAPSLSMEIILDPPVEVSGDEPFALSIPPEVDRAPVAVIAEAPIEKGVAWSVEAPLVVAATAPPPVPPPLAAPPSAAPAPVTPAGGVDSQVDDLQQVRAVLQRYRAAYDRLDARLAQAVWPGVNQAALARAFEGLESQTLTFDDCDVHLRGSTASARCTGTARYVPKVGSREPRVDPLVWNFALRKGASEWEIETARADR